MKLLGEEIDSEVAVLASLSRSSDTDNLARATLEDQQIANANVMTRDGDGIRSSTALDIANVLTDTLADTGGTAIFLVDYHLLTLSAMAMRMERVEDTISGFLDAVTE